MGLAKPLGQKTLSEQELKADKKTIKTYDQCGLGEKAIYMGGKMMPRKFYVPYESVTHVFKRIGVSDGTGKGFLSPILYIVVRFDDGQEHQNSFRYLQDADKMLNQLEALHPEICLMSPEGEKKHREKEAEEQRIQNRILPDEVEHEKRVLQSAKHFIEKRPSLYEKLAVTAKVKRSLDLMKPSSIGIAIGVLVAGIIAFIIGLLLQRRGGFGSIPILIMLVGAAMVFVMVNSKILPTGKRNKKQLEKDYNAALADMERSLKAQKDFPLPPQYCHPYVVDRMIRILQEERATTAAEALDVLKADLKRMDSSVALADLDYKQVVTIKPLFTVRNYD